MTVERLSSIAIISVHKERAKNLDLDRVEAAVHSSPNFLQLRLSVLLPPTQLH